MYRNQQCNNLGSYVGFKGILLIDIMLLSYWSWSVANVLHKHEIVRTNRSNLSLRIMH